MTTSVELVWEPECPNADAARAVLREALRAAGMPEVWTEWEIGSDELPTHARGFGSPTILVDGQEVTGHHGGDSDDCCRVYVTDEGYAGVPSAASVVVYLEKRGIRQRGRQ
jgi:mercuric ion transport protein